MKFFDKQKLLIITSLVTLGFGINLHAYEEDDGEQDAAPRQQKTSSASALRAKIRRHEKQREIFHQAEKALVRREHGKFRQLSRQIRDYPLYSYLVYEDYTNRLKSLSRRQLDRFFNEFGKSPVGYKLRLNYLDLLAKRKQWRLYLKYSVKTRSKRYSCRHREALYRTGQRQAALKNINEIWFTHRSLPTACDFIIRKWGQHGRLTRGVIWGRIELTFRKRQYRRARALRRYLPRSQRHWVNTWYNVYRKPRRITNKKLFRSRNPIALKIMTHGMIRLSRRKPDMAGRIWRRTLSRKKFSRKQRAVIKRAIGLSYAYKHRPEANYWLRQVPDSLADKQVLEWRVRSTLGQLKWRQVLRWLNKFDENTLENPRWMYWRARALEKTGQRTKAREIFREVAQTRSFEGFLAADRMKMPYTFENRKLYFPEDQVLRLETSADFMRARELYFLDRKLQARREWYNAIKKLGKRQLKMAAMIAHRWGWHDRTILTLGKARYLDDLKLRFPVSYKHHVMRQYRKTQVEPQWAMAVIRRESAFAVDARSRVGARGLMQLMPRTARMVARRIRARYRRTTELYKAKLNIRLGMNYLRMALNKFNDHKVLATAAYNAGGHRVTKWLRERGKKSADVWIETIPFTETRDYCRNVMAYTTIYEQRMGLKTRKLTDRLPPISPSTYLPN